MTIPTISKKEAQRAKYLSSFRRTEASISDALTQTRPIANIATPARDRILPR